jgi:peptidoglycan/LPS O-acetylase OafA/YrhL
MGKTDDKRIFEIDFLKTFGIVCVILAHLYIYLETPIQWWHQTDIAELGLSCFFFSSAYTLSKHNDFSTDEKIKQFLIKRAKRIYPLYWLAIVVDIIVFKLIYSKNHDLSNLTVIDYIFHFLGIQQIGLVPAYKTGIMPYLWFIGVILFYYVLYVLIIKYSKSDFEILRNSLLTYIAMFSFYFSERIYMYFPIFILGVFLGRCQFLDRLARYTSKLPDLVASTFEYTAYSSYAVYLFHGPFLSLMGLVNARLGLAGVVDMVCMVGFYIPALFLICYCIQKTADRNLIFKKSKTKNGIINCPPQA